MINKGLILLFLLLFHSSAYAQMENWEGIESYVAWFNAYESPGLLSLEIDSRPAMKNNAPGNLFSRTKFPPGRHMAVIKDSRNSKTVSSGELLVKEKGNHLLVTHGANGDCKLSFLHQDEFLEGDENRFIFLVNAMSGGSVRIVRKSDDGSERTEIVDSTLKYQILPKENNHPITLEFSLETGQKRRETINLPSFDEFQGLILIAYLDSDDFANIRFAVIDPKTLQLLSIDERQAAEE